MSLAVYAAEIPTDAKLDYNQGIDFYKLGMYERAIESFRSAIKTYPDYIDAYYNLGTVLEYLKQYSEAINAYTQVYLRNPNDYEVIYKLAYLNSKIENYTKTNELLKQIPSSSSYYQRGLELSESVKKYTDMPQQQHNAPSKISSHSGIYENILSPTGITTDNAGNLLSEQSALKSVEYAYNAQNRLIWCQVIDTSAREYSQTAYAYDALGRRVLVQDVDQSALRTIYDGFSFDVIKTSPTYASGMFTDSSETGKARF